MTYKLEKRALRLPRGARVGPKNEPVYGWAEVDALCQGGLAVHKAMKGERHKWSVTHEGSGYLIGPLCASTKARALANMQAALTIGFDWSRGERETLDALRQSRGIVDECRRIGGGVQ